MRRIVLGVISVLFLGVISVPHQSSSPIFQCSVRSPSTSLSVPYPELRYAKSPGIVGQRGERCANGVYCNYHHLHLSIVRSTVGGWLGGKRWKLQALIQAARYLANHLASQNQPSHRVVASLCLKTQFSHIHVVWVCLQSWMRRAPRWICDCLGCRWCRPPVATVCICHHLPQDRFSDQRSHSTVVNARTSDVTSRTSARRWV
jgi:hypothetical protein